MKISTEEDIQTAKSQTCNNSHLVVLHFYVFCMLIIFVCKFNKVFIFWTRTLMFACVCANLIFLRRVLWEDPGRFNQHWNSLVNFTDSRMKFACHSSFQLLLVGIGQNNDAILNGSTTLKGNNLLMSICVHSIMLLYVQFALN